jgi:hypothetical protein
MGIQAIKIYAEISLGGELTITSPDPQTDGIILSFQINKNRMAPTTFSASLKVLHEKITKSPIGNVTIRAGVNSADKLLFTGFIKAAKLRPCFDDPAYVLMDIQGMDILHILQGKTFTSRSRATKSSWVAIEGVTRQGLKSDKFKPTPQETFNMVSTDRRNEDNTTTSAPVPGPKMEKAPTTAGTHEEPLTVNAMDEAQAQA